MIWLKWSWRDLRSRWVQVAVIAVVIAFGTGMFSGLRSMNVWRALSNEASYAASNTFDLRVSLGAGSFVERGALLEGLAEVAGDGVAVAEERLILPTQVSVDTDTPEGTALVPGRLIGVDLSEGGPHVNSLHAALGRSLTSVDAGADVVALEHNFARFYELPPAGDLSLAGGMPVEYVGHTLAPEYFFIVTPEGGILAQANFAAVFTSIETAQRLTGKADAVNDLILRLSPDTDTEALFDALTARFEGVGGTVARRMDDPSIRLMIEDVEGDQQFNTVMAIAIFGGAVFAAFNLTSRIVDSQRREIGISMALGLPTFLVGLRPLLFSAQVGLLGVVFGIAMGIGVAEALGAYLEGFIPLPAWRTPFQFGVFAWAALAGFLLPFAAAAIPVWLAVRVPPVNAIRTGHLAARGGGLAWMLSRVRIPARVMWQMPLRNVARAPRRTLLTSLGIGAIVAVLVTVMGMLYSFVNVFDSIERETTGDAPDRMEVSLDTFYPVGAPTVRSILESPNAVNIEAGIRVGGTLSASGEPDESFDVLAQFIDFESELWRPTVAAGSLDISIPGVVISESAADDLGAGVGDMLILRHPVFTGVDTASLGETSLPVLGLHPHPFRTNVYLHVEYSSMLGGEGIANLIQARPAAGVSPDTLELEFFALPGVGAVQKSATLTNVIRDQFQQYMGLLSFILLITLVLALLIAYNTASINMDERRREHATMFAYGLPVRSVLGMAATESAIMGAIATALGLAAGWLLLQWVVLVLLPDTFPELHMSIVFPPAGLALVVVMGIAASAAAPLFTVWRLRRMDVPSTLRVME